MSNTGEKDVEKDVKKDVETELKIIKKNNETFGMTVEKAICEIYELKNNIDNIRIDKKIINEIKPLLVKYLNNLKSKPNEYGGGPEYDFMMDNGKNMQVKTNFNSSDKVCPPKIGQCTKKTFISNIAKKINEDIELNNDNDIKNFIFNNTKKILKLYIDAYYTSDYILYIKKPKNKDYFITLYDKINFDEKLLEKCEISFTKNPTDWNESSTLRIIYKYKKYSIGEFQIHNNRDGVKFRFNRHNFHNLIENIYIDLKENVDEIINKIEQMTINNITNINEIDKN